MSKKVFGASLILFASLFANAQDQKVNKNKPASIALKASILNFKKTPLTEGLTVSTPAVGLQFFKGLAPKLDAVVNLDISSLKYPYYVSSKQPKATSNSLYAAIDARVHLKLATDDKAMLPYAILGIGLAKDAANSTAYAPMGLGLQFKAKQGSFVHLFSTYNAEASKLTKMHMNYGLSYSFPLKLKEKKAIALPTAPVQADQDDDDEQNLWIGDSGASCHYCNSEEGLYDYTTILEEITVGNGNKMLSKKVGSLRCMVQPKHGEKFVVILKDVKFVPELWVNLFSISKALKNGFNLGVEQFRIAGKKIGTGAVIGSGAVVTKDIPPYAIAVGVPGRVVKYRFPKHVIEQLQSIAWWDWDRATLVERFNELLDLESFIAKYGASPVPQSEQPLPATLAG